MGLPCEKEQIIANMKEELLQLKIDMAVAKSDMRNLREDIKSIKAKLNQSTWWFLSLLVTIISGLVVILLQIKGVG